MGVLFFGLPGYLSGGLLHEALIGELEGPAEGLARVLAEGFLVGEVDVQVVGGVIGSIHATVTVKHGEVSLLFLILQDESGHMTSVKTWQSLQHANPPNLISECFNRWELLNSFSKQRHCQEFI